MTFQKAMTVMALCLFGFVAVAVGPAAFGQTEEVLAGPKITYSFTLDDSGTIAGPARDWLLNKGLDARFVMVGETHGVAEIPVFSQALYDLTARTSLAIETDPWTALHIEQLIAGGDAALKEHFSRRSNQYRIPFYAWREEAAFLGHVIKKAGGIKPTLWGLDQIFVLSGKTIADRLRPLLKKKATLQALERFEVKLAARPALIGYADFSEIEPFYQALLSEDSVEAQEIAEALKLSNRIYAPFTRGDGAALIANKLREEQMKKLFFTYFSESRKAIGLQRPMLKFGSGHMYRGVTPTGVIGLGGFVSALATARGEGSLALSLHCGPEGAKREFDGQETPCTQKSFNKVFPLVSSLINDQEGHFLIDTLALRLSAGDALAGASDAERAEIYSFDAIVIINNPTPAGRFDATVEDFDLAAQIKAETELQQQNSARPEN